MNKIELMNKIMELLGDVRQDSLEVSTPAKGGAIKVYCNFDNVEETKTRIDNAVEARAYANEKIKIGD